MKENNIPCETAQKIHDLTLQFKVALIAIYAKGHEDGYKDAESDLATVFNAPVKTKRDKAIDRLVSYALTLKETEPV